MLLPRFCFCSTSDSFPSPPCCLLLVPLLSPPPPYLLSFLLLLISSRSSSCLSPLVPPPAYSPQPPHKVVPLLARMETPKMVKPAPRPEGQK
eukprot:334336-Hanusia_phi.AAC.1